MAREGKIGYRRNTRNKVQLKDKGSDESDEDYNVSEDEGFHETEDEECFSLAEDESEESLGGFEEEEEEWFEKKVKTVARPRVQKGFQWGKKNRVVKTRTKKLSCSEEDEDNDFVNAKKRKRNKLSHKQEDGDDMYVQDDDSGGKRLRISRTKMNVDGFDEKPRKKNKVSYIEEHEDGDYDDFEDKDDEEFIPDQDDRGDEKWRIPRTKVCGDGFDKKPGKKSKVSYREEKEESDYDDSEDQDDDEFIPDSDDSGDKKGRTSCIKTEGVGFADKPRKKNKVSYIEEEEEDDSLDEDDDEFTPDNDDCDSKIFRTSRIKIYGNGLDEKPRKKNKVSYREEEEDDSLDEDDDDFTPDKDDCDNTNLRTSRKKIYGGGLYEKPRKKNKVSYIEEKEYSDYGGSDDETDDEFTPDQVEDLDDEIEDLDDEVEDLDDEDELPVIRKNKADRVKIQETWIPKGRRKKRNQNVFKKIKREKPVREGSEFCKGLTSCLRSSNCSKTVKEDEPVPSQRKRLRKGKEKVVDLKIVVGKQVCGICLSEEGKRTVRGILNCCSHYFCFACIMEWSKVESRCPLCKQRFETISRTNHDLRDTVISVPERDQVYQPSEEELRGYLDPYENVLCFECQQGGDDEHMLLCDLCDSPAHTYCVGLGNEVPDGNWYCDGCRPTALASSNNTDRRATNDLSVGSSPLASVRETFDLNEVYVPDTPLSQVAGAHSPSPRYSIADSQASAPASGSGAFTLFQRRQVQRQIHRFIHNRIRQSDRNDSGTTLFGTQIGQDVVRAPHDTFMPARTVPQDIFNQGRLQDYGTPSLYSTEFLSRSLRGQALRDQGSTSMDQYFAGMSHGEFSGFGARIGGALGHQQLQPCSSRSNSGVTNSILPYQFQEQGTVPSRTLQGSLRPPF